MEYQTILYEERDSIAYILINMAPANKMNAQFLMEIVNVIEKAVLNKSLHGIIVSGEGRHFSSGMDIEQLMQLLEQSVNETNREVKIPIWYERVKQAFDLLYDCDIPVIAAINGLCIGSGFELALHAHLQIAEKNAMVGLPETTFGLLPGIHGTLRTMEKLGYKKAIEMILKGDLYKASEACEKKLVDVIVPKKASIVFAEKLIDYIYEQDANYSKENAQSLLHDFVKSQEGELDELLRQNGERGLIPSGRASSI